MFLTDICIIGAGPVGLFAVFEAGLLKMRCHLIDSLPQVGGQLAEIYPEKPIYDIPGYPVIKAKELIDNLMLQAEPFKPSFTLGERVENIERQEDASFLVKTNEGTTVHCKAIAIAGGLGCFEPRKPAIEGLEKFEGRGIQYMVKNPEQFRDKRIVLAGGGDSALDWALYLSEIASKVTLIHRGSIFRGAPDNAQKVAELAEKGTIDLFLKSHLMEVSGNGHLSAVSFKNDQENIVTVPTDYLIPLFGLSPKLGPIADWGLELEFSAIKVNTKDFATSETGIFAIGDINTYPGKMKLILCGFHEAAMMMKSAFKFVYPNERLVFNYTTVNGIQEF